MYVSFCEDYFGKSISKVSEEDLVNFFSTEREENLTLDLSFCCLSNSYKSHFDLKFNL